MNVGELLRSLTDAFPYMDYARIMLTWHPSLVRWEARLSYWQIEGGLKRHPWGLTPEEAVRNLVSQLKGKILYRTGPSGNRTSFRVEEEVISNDMAFSEAKPPPGLVEGLNEVLAAHAIRLVEAAEKVFLLTFVGQRPIKGYPEETLVEVDKAGKGLERLLDNLRRCKEDCPIEVGVYDGGKTIGLRGGIL